MKFRTIRGMLFTSRKIPVDEMEPWGTVDSYQEDIMEYNQSLLIDFKPRHDFFIGSDSDGCVFDTMEIKQKECFCPNNIKYWKLQPVAKYAR
jgi:hypothetical protein